MVEKYGILTKTPATGAPMQSPYLPVVNKQAQIMLPAAEQLARLLPLGAFESSAGGWRALG